MSQMSVTILPPTRGAGVPRGPKLTLQTSSISLPFSPKPRLGLSINTPSTESPTVRNTLANTFSATSSVSSPGYHQPSAPTTEQPPSIVTTPSKTFSASPSSSSEASPSSFIIPYTLAIGSHSILRNSPIPRAPISTTSLRHPRRFFPDTKRVAFKEKLVDLSIPPLAQDSDSDTDSSISSLERGRRTLRLQKGEAQPIEKSSCSRGKRRRELAWPTGPSDDNDDDLPDPKHASPPSTSPVTSPVIYLQPLTFSESPIHRDRLIGKEPPAAKQIT